MMPIILCCVIAADLQQVACLPKAVGESAKYSLILADRLPMVAHQQQQVPIGADCLLHMAELFWG
jgi:hypothetical protein